MQTNEGVVSSFEVALDHVLRSEGGYSFHPDDRGGPTNWGIVLAELKRWRQDDSLTSADVKALTKQEAAQIYRTYYWNAMSLDQVQSPEVATILFDQGVNRGVKTVAIQVQRVLNNAFGFGLEVDGVLGSKSIAALNSVRADEFIIEFVSAAQDSYADIVVKNPRQLVFLKGWLNRTQMLLKLLVKKLKA